MPFRSRLILPDLLNLPRNLILPSRDRVAFHYLSKLPDASLVKLISKLIISRPMDTELDNSFGFIIHDVTRLLRWEFDRQAQDLGLTRAQWSVLAHLQRNQGVQQKDLALAMDIKPITLARHLDRLEQDGWITRKDDAADRRAKRLHLTEKAKPMIRSLKNVGKQVRKKALQGISEQDLEQFMSILFNIRSNLGQSPQGGRKSP